MGVPVKRRTFMQVLAGFFGAALVPKLAGADSAPEEMERVQYGAMYSERKCADGAMPGRLRQKLDERAACVAEMVGGPIVSREYMWLPWSEERYEKADMLHLDAYAGIKFEIEVPKAQRDAAFKAGGWIPFDQYAKNGDSPDYELADRGGVRYARAIKNGQGNG